MKTISVPTKTRSELIDITDEVERVVKESGIRGGLCVVFSPHTTAGLTINENADPSVKSDIINQTAKIVPYGKHYAHLEGNSDAHIKASLMGSSLSIIIMDNKLVLGRWQGIYFCEFDGPRERRVNIKIIGDKVSLKK